MVAALCVSMLLDQWFLSNLGTLLILQLAVVIVALMSSRLAAIWSGFIGALGFNYLFTAPHFSLHMSEATDIINMSVFLVIAVITSYLASEHRQQGEALRRAELRSSILLSVSHDLRTPLATIIGTLSSLQNYGGKLSQDEQHELLQSSIEESHRLHQYIENLLQATKLQQGEVRLKMTLQPLVHSVSAAVTRCRSSRISLQTDEVKDVAVQGSLFEQALFNVLDNALKYSPEETPVKVELTGNEEQVNVRVSDLGRGVSEEEKDKIFELFYSSRRGDTGEGGSGLGLAVAAGIIHAHGGDIQLVDSTHGCTFDITLPVPKE